MFLSLGAAIQGWLILLHMFGIISQVKSIYFFLFFIVCNLEKRIYGIIGGTHLS